MKILGVVFVIGGILLLTKYGVAAEQKPPLQLCTGICAQTQKPVKEHISADNLGW